MLGWIVAGLLVVPPTSGHHLIISERAISAAFAAHPPAQKPPSRDSLKNGAIIGAIAGAALFGGYVTFLCNVLREPSDPSCLGSSLVAVAIGVGGGAAAGAGIDALFSRPQNQFLRRGAPDNHLITR